MKKAVKILLGCAAVGTIATVVTKIVKDIKEEKEYFNSVLEKLKSEHKQIVADKQEIDLQLGAGIRTGRRKEDFEKKEERAEE